MCDESHGLHKVTLDSNQPPSRGTFLPLTALKLTALKSISHSFVHDSRDDRLCGSRSPYPGMTCRLNPITVTAKRPSRRQKPKIIRLVSLRNTFLVALVLIRYHSTFPWLQLAPLDAKAPLFNVGFHPGGPMSVLMSRFNTWN
jgi:hypothetical protein